MNTLQHEYFHKLDDQRNAYKNHLLHASVDERASRTRTFAHTSDELKLSVAIEFSELVMNAYYQPNNNTKADVMNLIDKFNQNNTGNIFLKFNPAARTMEININNFKKTIKYVPSIDKFNFIISKDKK
jgi:RHS repeat-associated core domain protein